MIRRNREINIFNLSMLDVICCALGAMVILFIVTSKRKDEEAARAQAAEQQNQQLTDKARAVEERAKRLAEDLDDALKRAKEAAESLQQGQLQAEALAKALKDAQEKAKALGQGQVIGMCETTAARVEVQLWDHGGEDGDLVQITVNSRDVAQRLELRNAPQSFQLELEPGGNYITALALNEGARSPNTASVVINPCHGDQPDTFEWNMLTGQKRTVSVVRQ